MLHFAPRAYWHPHPADDCRALCRRLRRHGGGPDIAEHDERAWRRSTITIACRPVARIVEIDGGQGRVGRQGRVSAELFATMADFFSVRWAFRGTDDIPGKRARLRLAMY